MAKVVNLVIRNEYPFELEGISNHRDSISQTVFLAKEISLSLPSVFSVYKNISTLVDLFHDLTYLLFVIHLKVS